jgi:hypothetical protein
VITLASRTPLASKDDLPLDKQHKTEYIIEVLCFTKYFYKKGKKLMQTPLSLKTAERRAFQTTFADGLWDIFIGCFALMFAIAPLLSETLGDFWSSAVFLPFFGAVYLAIWLTRKYVVALRIGTVSFARPRREKIARFTMIMLVVNVVIGVLGILVALFFTTSPSSEQAQQVGFVISLVLGLFLLAGFSLAGYLLDFPRLYFYGLLLFIGPFLGEWLFQNHLAVHHGYPIVFGFIAGVMIITGLVSFLRLLKHNPPLDLPDERA